VTCQLLEGWSRNGSAAPTSAGASSSTSPKIAANCLDDNIFATSPNHLARPWEEVVTTAVVVGVALF
jgi:hypothetical protein